MKRIVMLLLVVTLTIMPLTTLASGTVITEGYPLVAETVTYTVLNPSSSGEKWENMRLFQVMEQVTGIHFEFSNTPSGEYANQQNLKLASGDIPDIMWNAMDSSTIVKYGVEGGMLLNIAPYIDSCMPKVIYMSRAHLDMMIPDGAWDNSFGSRTFKWTYWGSRTSDGCQTILNALGKKEHVFAEAALRNVELYHKTTYDGLLYGGPHYKKYSDAAIIASCK